MTTVRADPLELLRARTSVKWTLHPPEVLPLFVAEMDYPLAEPITAALVDAVSRSDTGYAVGPGALAPAFASFAAGRWGWTVEPSRIRTTSDVSVAIVETLRAAITPGDAVIVTPPVYPPFYGIVAEAGGVVERVPLVQRAGVEVAGEAGFAAGFAAGGTAGFAAGDWALDLAEIERAFAAGARALLLCNPHNPLGLVHSASELAALAELAARYGALVISDEVHAPLIHPDASFTPFLSVSDAARSHGVCVTSASKGWNLAGLKCAMIIAGDDASAVILDRMPPAVTWRTSIMGLLGNTAAFSLGEPWLDGAIDAIVENRRLLSTLLAEHLPAARLAEPTAGYLAWIDLRALGWGDDPAARILADARVALNPGPEFGAEGIGHVRLNFACSPDMLTDAVRRIAALA